MSDIDGWVKLRDLLGGTDLEPGEAQIVKIARQDNGHLLITANIASSQTADFTVTIRPRERTVVEVSADGYDGKTDTRILRVDFPMPEDLYSDALRDAAARAMIDVVERFVNQEGDAAEEPTVDTDAT